MLIIKIIIITLLVIIFITILSGVIGLIMAIRKLGRVDKVVDFRDKLCNMAEDYVLRNYPNEGVFESEEVWNWFVNKYTFEEMVKSSKPLTLEAWYTPKEIKRINS